MFVTDKDGKTFLAKNVQSQNRQTPPRSITVGFISLDGKYYPLDELVSTKVTFYTYAKHLENEYIRKHGAAFAGLDNLEIPDNIILGYN